MSLRTSPQTGVVTEENACGAISFDFGGSHASGAKSRLRRLSPCMRLRAQRFEMAV